MSAPPISTARPATAQPPAVVPAAEVEPSIRLGGELRAVLTPGRVDATAGFLGTGTLAAGAVVTEHYHPYSDEFLYVIDGRLAITVDAAQVVVPAGSAVMIRRGARHRFEAGAQGAHWVYVMTPLAPRPELGHVDTEPAAHPASAPPSLGTPSLGAGR